MVAWVCGHSGAEDVNLKTWIVFCVVDGGS